MSAEVATRGASDSTPASVISSLIIASVPIAPLPQGQTTYVEVPVVEEVTKTVNVRKIIEKHVPKIETTEVTRTIDIPKLKIVEKTVEVPRVREVVKTVPVKRVVEVEHERVNHVTKVETKTIEKEVEVMGEIIEVPKPFLIENRVVAPRFVDQPVPTVVTQTLIPRFVESDEYVIQVRLREYEPEVIPVDIFLPKPIDRNIVVTGNVTRDHVPVHVPLAQYNSLIAAMNNRTDDAESEPTDPAFWVNNMLVPNSAGSVPVLSREPSIVPPESDDWKDTYDEKDEYIIRNQRALTPRSSSPHDSAGVKRVPSRKVSP